MDVFAIKIIDLNVEIKIFSKKTMASLVFEINNNAIYKKISLIKYNITVLFQIIVVKSKILFLEILFFT